MVVAEALKNCYNQGKEPDLYYFRDNHGFEIDLILGKDFERAIEIKAAETFDFELAKNVCKFYEMAKTLKRPTVVYAGEQKIEDGVEFRNFNSQVI
jgi:predicted AAA+ superfamily ATPase